MVRLALVTSVRCRPVSFQISQRVHRPEEHLAGLGALAQTGHGVEQPAQFRAREVRREWQPAALAVAVLADVAAQLAHQRGRAHVLPVDRVVNRRAGLALPDERRLALVGDAEGHEVRGGQLRVVQRALHDLLDVAPDLLGVLLDPPRTREHLLVLLLGDRHDAGRAVEHDAARGRGPLVDRRHVLLAHRHALFTKGSLPVRVKLRGRPRGRTPPGRRAAGARPAAARAAPRRPSPPRSPPGGRGSAPRTTPRR